MVTKLNKMKKSLTITGFVVSFIVQVIVLLSLLDVSLDGLNSNITMNILGGALGFIFFAILLAVLIPLNKKFLLYLIKITKKKMKTFKKLMFALLLLTVITSCSRIDAGHEGMKVNLYGSDRGIDDVNLVTGWVFYNPMTTKVYEYPMFIKTVDYEAFKLNSKDGSEFIVDPTIQLSIVAGKSPEVFRKYRLPFETIVAQSLSPFIINAYRVELNKYTADQLISDRETFEKGVENRLREQLALENFNLGECTSGLIPPQSLVEAINAKNKAVQDQLRVENEVKVAEAEAKKLVVAAEAEKQAYNLRMQSLTPLLVQQQMIQKWDGKLPVYGTVPTLFRDITK